MLHAVVKSPFTALITRQEFHKLFPHFMLQLDVRFFKLIERFHIGLHAIATEVFTLLFT